MIELKTSQMLEDTFSEGEMIGCYEQIQDLCIQFALNPETASENWPPQRVIYSQIAAFEGDKVVGAAMLVVDQNEDAVFDDDLQTAHIWGMGVLPSYRTSFLIRSLEDALLADGAGGIDADFITAEDGRQLPNPYSNIDSVMSQMARHLQS